jgi:hypothetical protein
MNARIPPLAFTAALVAVAVLSPLALPVHAAEQGSLIARKDIFGNPTRTLPAISPDGKNIAYIAPRDGVLNVFVAPRDNIGAAKPVTADKKRGIRGFFWTQNSRQLIYTQDEGGDENWRIHVVDVATAQDTIISPAGKVQGQMIATSVTKPDEILIGINDRDPQNHDVYRHNLKAGERTLLFKNDDGYSAFVVDDSLALRMAAKQTPGGGLEVFKRDAAGKMTSFTKISPEDALTSQFVGFDVPGTTLYALDSRGRDKAALVTIDIDRRAGCSPNPARPTSATLRIQPRRQGAGCPDRVPARRMAGDRSGSRGRHRIPQCERPRSVEGRHDRATTSSGRSRSTASPSRSPSGCMTEVRSSSPSCSRRGRTWKARRCRPCTPSKSRLATA